MAIPDKETHPHLSHPRYRPDIDGLRAVAVMSVVLFHAFPGRLPGGFTGVDVFFIISGYLISTIIYGSLDRNSFSFMEFYARRIKRIFPALLLVLVSCYVFGWFALFGDEFSQLGKHIAGGAAFISNIVLWDESGYFDTTSDIKPLLHLWSLGIEEQFYILWPFILWAAWKIRINTLVATLVILIGSLSINIFNVNSYPAETFYFPQSRAWELLSGSILAYLTIHGYVKYIGIALRNILSVSGMALLVYGFFFSKSDGFPGWQAIVPCLGSVMVIMAGHQSWINGKILSSKPFVWLGLISFPLYLWHWPLLTFPRIINSGPVTYEVRIAAVMAAIALSALTFYFIENPLKKYKWNYKTALLIVLMAVVGFVGYLTYCYDGITSRSTIVNAKKINSQMFEGRPWTFAKNETCLNRYDFEDAKTYWWWFCITNHDKKPTVVLLGNSFANHLYPGIIKQFPNETVLSIGTCDPTFTRRKEFPAHPCSGDKPLKQKEYIDSIIRESGTVKTVIVDGLCQFPIDERCTFKNDEYIQLLNKRIEYMSNMGIKVIFFAPHLTLDYNIRACMSRPFKKPQMDCLISKEKHKEAIKSFVSEMRQIKDKYSNVYIFDQNTAFCNESGCNMMVDGIPVFRDEYYHFTQFASEKVGEKFKEWLIKKDIKI